MQIVRCIRESYVKLDANLIVNASVCNVSRHVCCRQSHKTQSSKALIYSFITLPSHAASQISQRRSTYKTDSATTVTSAARLSHYLVDKSILARLATRVPRKSCSYSRLAGASPADSRWRLDNRYWIRVSISNIRLLSRAVEHATLPKRNASI